MLVLALMMAGFVMISYFAVATTRSTLPGYETLQQTDEGGPAVRLLKYCSGY